MIVVMSLWRNDAARGIEARMSHLLSKTCKSDDVRWLWAVGDSTDDTESMLRAVAAHHPNIEVVRYDSGVAGNDNVTARRRASATATEMFAHVRETDTWACLHESDILSPSDVLDRLLVTGRSPVAGWPLIVFNKVPQFYDIWAYRDVRGVPFLPDIIPPRQEFEVTSFGTLWLAPASLVRGRILNEYAIVGLCDQWRCEGVHLWVDPRIVVEQPALLWEPR